MPDVNKLAKMNQVGFRIAESCPTCVHRPHRFGGVSERPWGLCTLHDYEHAKHDWKPFPAHVGATCDHYERDTRNLSCDPALELGEYAKILDRSGG